MHSNRLLLPSSNRILALDGLRFFAAFFVMAAHFVHFIVKDQGIHNELMEYIGSLSGLGMPLFFLLSGFVIHYNYHRLYSEPQGVKKYLVARFTRLYPLYIVILSIECIAMFYTHRGSCGHAGDRLGFLFALPYYITLTQDWVYGIIGTNSLIYQFDMAAQVSWSISLEMFFYFSYFFILLWFVKKRSVANQVIWFVVSYLFVVFYLMFCCKSSHEIDHVALVGFGSYATTAHGYGDSLLRWLYYFNPIVNLPAFFEGAIIANIYLYLKERSLLKIEQFYGGLLTSLTVLIIFVLHYWLYSYVGKTNSFIGRTSSVLITPLIALMIFCVIRYTTLISRFISRSLFVKLGEASYSIYLLHAFFAWYPRDFYYLKLNPWALYVLSMICILILSRLTYIFFELPVQRFLKRKMMQSMDLPSKSAKTSHASEELSR